MSETKTGQHRERNEQRDIPPPTIVGPRPEAESQGQMPVPRGLERLLTLACLSEEWRNKTLADPVRAAGEAQIELSPSESAILKTIPQQTLGQMIVSFVRNRLAPMRDTALAAGTAAAALLATTTYGGEPATDGIRPDVPEPRAEKVQANRHAIQWETSLDVALAKAAIANQAVMVVCPLSAKRVTKKTGPPFSRGITMEIPSSPFLSEVCEKDNAAVADAISGAGLIAVRPPPLEDHRLYVARLESYRVSDAAPLVFFLAPDGTMLSQLVQPASEHTLVEAIRTVPPVLAAWIIKHSRPIAPAPSGTKGIRPE